MGEKLSAIFEQRKNRAIVGICIIVCITAIVVLVVHNGQKDSGSTGSISEVSADITYEAAYESLAALKTAKYNELSVEEFANQVQQEFAEKTFQLEDAIEVVEQAINKDDDNYDFIMHTLKATQTELDSDCKVPYEMYDKEISYVSLTGEQDKIYVLCEISYNIDDRNNVTVEKRDSLIEEIFTEIENDMNRMLLSTMKESEIKEQLVEEVNDCIESLDASGIELSFAVKEVNVLE